MTIDVQDEDLKILKQLQECPISYLVETPSHEIFYTDTQYGPKEAGSGLSYHVNNNDIILSHISLCMTKRTDQVIIQCNIITTVY